MSEDNLSCPLRACAGADRTPPSAAGAGADLGRLSDVPVELAVEIGRTRMTVGATLELRPGSIVVLDRVAGEPVDLLVNGTPIARGEVVVIDEEFALRVTEVLGERGAAAARRDPTRRRGGLRIARSAATAPTSSSSARSAPRSTACRSRRCARSCATRRAASGRERRCRGCAASISLRGRLVPVHDLAVRLGVGRARASAAAPRSS